MVTYAYMSKGQVTLLLFRDEKLTFFSIQLFLEIRDKVI